MLRNLFLSSLLSAAFIIPVAHADSSSESPLDVTMESQLNDTETVNGFYRLINTDLPGTFNGGAAPFRFSSNALIPSDELSVVWPSLRLTSGSDGTTYNVCTLGVGGIGSKHEGDIGCLASFQCSGTPVVITLGVDGMSFQGSCFTKYSSWIR